jgi:hypothetical protein
MMGSGADSADAWNDDWHLFRWHSLDHDAEAALFHSLEAGGNDLSIADFDLNPRMAFNAG